MFLAGIVLFNPDENRLMENINKIIVQVDKVLLIDNNSDNYENVYSNLKDNDKIAFIHNDCNYGIAYALNEILNFAYENKYDWFITLDQDSVAYDNLIQEYAKYIDLPKVAMLTCIIKDRNMLENEKQLSKDAIEVKQCITSGAFNNTAILKLVGGFDNEMFIDYVDFDISRTLTENDYLIYKINYIGLLHEVGKGKLLSIFGKKIHLFNHNEKRVYYHVRNAIYFIRKHKKKSKVLINRINLMKRIILILLFEKNKKKNFIAINKGIIDGLKMKIG